MAEKQENQFLWLWSYMGKYHARIRRGLVCGLILAALSSSMLVLNPWLSKKLIDEVIIPQNSDNLLSVLGLMMIVQMTRLTLRYIMAVVMEIESTKTLTFMRRNLFDVIQNADFNFRSKFPTGNLMTRMTSDLDMLRHTVAWITFSLVDAIVVFGAAFIFLLTVNWKFALCLLSVSPVLLYFSARFMKRIRPRFVVLRSKLSELSAHVTEAIDGNRVIKAFAREEYEKERFEKLNSTYRDTSVENAMISAKYQPLLEGGSQILMVITLLVGGYFLIIGELTPGEYLAFSSLSWALSGPLRTLAMLLADWQRFNASAVMLREIIEHPIGISDVENAKDAPKSLKGNIDFVNVSLTLANNPVLKNINLSIKHGQTVGILGSTGAGKTSLVNLLTRLYEPTEGEVLLDGVNVRDYKLLSLRKNIAVAMQEVFLFSDTVAANIAYARPDLPFEQIERCALKSDVDAFVRKMEDGYETIVGERGVGLSGGQKQRIALSRALAVGAPVLVLDDTTSAVDSETESYIQKQLLTLDTPCTKIIIAQRISSFKGADFILVMDNGEIIERGTHEELLAKKGFYYEIWALQNGKEVDAA